MRFKSTKNANFLIRQKARLPSFAHWLADATKNRTMISYQKTCLLSFAQLVPHVSHPTPLMSRDDRPDNWASLLARGFAASQGPKKIGENFAFRLFQPAKVSILYDEDRRIDSNANIMKRGNELFLAAIDIPNDLNLAHAIKPERIVSIECYISNSESRLVFWKSHLSKEDVTTLQRGIRDPSNAATVETDEFIFYNSDRNQTMHIRFRDFAGREVLERLVAIYRFFVRASVATISLYPLVFDVEKEDIITETHKMLVYLYASGLIYSNDEVPPDLAQVRMLTGVQMDFSHFEPFLDYFDRIFIGDQITREDVLMRACFGLTYTPVKHTLIEPRAVRLEWKDFAEIDKGMLLDNLTDIDGRKATYYGRLSRINTPFRHQSQNDMLDVISITEAVLELVLPPSQGGSKRAPTLVLYKFMILVDDVSVHEKTVLASSALSPYKVSKKNTKPIEPCRILTHCVSSAPSITTYHVDQDWHPILSKRTSHYREPFDRSYYVFSIGVTSHWRGELVVDSTHNRMFMFNHRDIITLYYTMQTHVDLSYKFKTLGDLARDTLDKWETPRDADFIMFNSHARPLDASISVEAFFDSPHEFGVYPSGGHIRGRMRPPRMYVILSE